MNKNLLIGVVLVLALLGGYMLLSNKQTPVPAVQVTPTTQPESASPSAMMSKEVFVPILEQNNSGEEGKASLTEVDGKVKVALTMTGSPKDVAQPAHIHVGVCPEVGAVKYPLTNVVNGVSETMLDVSLDQLKDQLPLGINVHKSAAEAKIYTACGDLKL